MEPVAPRAERGLALTRIEYQTRKIGAIVHDARLLDVPEFTDTFVPLIRIAMERDRLHRDLVSKLDQLKASRLRILQAADAERRRLERNLHDGAQQRLTASLLGMGTLASKLDADPELGQLARDVLEDLEGAIDDLRELARGCTAAPLEGGPRRRAESGRGARLAAGGTGPEPCASPPRGDRGRRVLRLRRGVHERGQAREGLGDMALRGRGRRRPDRGRQGRRHRRRVHRVPGGGDGARGLVDRVEALGGTLELVSPEGGGTTLTAIFPLTPDAGYEA